MRNERPSSARVIADIFGVNDGDKNSQTRAPRARPVRAPERRPRRILGLLAVIAFLFGGAVILSTRIFGSGANNTSSVVVGITAPEIVSPGDSISLTVDVKNNEHDSIDDAILFIRYPEGFKFGHSDPAPVEGVTGRWELGHMDRKAGATIKIDGTLLGTIGAVLSFDVTIEYRRPSFALRHTATASFVTRIEAPGIKFELTTPGETDIGQAFPFRLVVGALEEDLKDLELVLVPSLGVELSGLKPKPDRKPAIYLVKKLEKGKEKKFEGQITRSVTATTANMVATLRRRAASGPAIVLAERTLELAGLAAPITISTRAFGDGGDVHLGRPATIAITVTAGASGPFTDGHIALFLTGSPLSLVDFSSDTKSVGDALPKKSWATPVGPEAGPLATFALDNLDAGASRTVTIHFKLPDVGPTAGEQALPNLFLETFAIVEGKVHGQAVHTKTDPIPLKIGTGLTLDVSHELNEDGAVSVVWILKNGSNSIRDLALSAPLGAGVAIDGAIKGSIGDAPSYDPVTHRLLWHIPWLPAFAGTGKGTSVMASLSLHRDPTITADTPLIGSTVVSARDDFTGSVISLEFDPILP